MRPELTLALTLALPLVACGSPPPPPVALEEFSRVAREALCEWAVGCRHAPDQDTCQRLIDPKHYDTRRAEDAVAAGRLGWDAEAAGRCVDATRSAYCLAVPFSDDSCADYLVGLVAEGGACTSDYECAGNAPCEDVVCDVQCCLGVCGAPSTYDIDPPPLAGIGGECATHAECVPNAYCELDGVCTAMPDEEGERCLFGCEPGDLYCDVESFQCRAYAALGAPCDAEAVSAPPCNEAWSYCDGVCKPRPGQGQECDDERQRCIPVLFCGPGGTCEERGAAGATCANQNQCLAACDETNGECVDYETCPAQ